MSSISKTDQALQVALGRAPGSARPTDAGRVNKPAGDARASEAPRPDAPFDLDADVIDRVRRIARDAPDRRVRILRALLESCVARSFGTAASTDPGFQHVIDQAFDAMRSSPDLAQAMERLANHLDERSGS